MKRTRWLIGIISITLIILGFGALKIKQDKARADFLNNLHLDIRTDAESK